jgi:DNA (cytosine-5)-methyltransferase 1
MSKIKKIKFIDLFAGLGGTRLGFEKSARALGFSPDCVFTSEIKQSAVKVYSENFKDAEIKGDISKIEAQEIPDFDCLLGGFPCQPFSYSGKREGFMDTRGTLFFEIERILKEKKPRLFLLENVEGLVNHDKVHSKDEIGKTLSVILQNLQKLGYHVTWKVLNALDFGVPQERKRIYITGSLVKKIDLENFKKSNKKLLEVLEKKQPLLENNFTKKLLKHYTLKQLRGKSIKDKRGGPDNIHSWDFGLKGEISSVQRDLLNTIFKERRKKKWAKIKGIKWMDGMPLTVDEIYSFFSDHVVSKKELQKILDDLALKGYLKFEHPKNLAKVWFGSDTFKEVRKHDVSTDKGYNIVTGKLSFEISKILDPNGFCPTLVATDMNKIAVTDGAGIRKLTIREGLRLFGFPEKYQITTDINKAYDLLGNSIVVPVVEKVSERILKSLL